MRLPEMDMRGSGIYSVDREITLDEPCECGSVEAVHFTDDWGNVTVTCWECESTIDWPDPAEPDPDHEYDLWLERQWEEASDW